jgi:hypothetical protein
MTGFAQARRQIGIAPQLLLFARNRIEGIDQPYQQARVSVAVSFLDEVAADA